MTNIERLNGDSRIVVAGHRGYKAAYPENTLLAFDEALKRGVDMLEFDLRMSKDGEVVVIHDETVDRTTDGTGAVGDLKLAELARLDAGGWFGRPFEGLRIPTFGELCELLAAHPDVLLNVEIKSGPRAKEIADRAVPLLAGRCMLSRCVFTCFDADIIAYLHDAHGVKTQGFPAELMANFDHGTDGTYAKMWAVGLPVQLLTPKLVDEMRARGLQVWCYCPDDQAQVDYSLSCGVTVLTVNDVLPALRRREMERAAAI
ncbi:glycerophosphodiester phosphodiesterase family protein [Cohnella sp. REN36]|uniref:glycerophosphodiester phosphodiesterase family protein n=1 Tax=Cohnella sp. REN36 TaxID=2887347 RepID=UPI001D150CC7|nr:glycerophosphodiester phosphodiesterase family protein [Cohnella sp. REN36]MCC3375325.1 glycerophosphodiester phosphodiesterase [Cohnella sp. REN36]